MSDIADRIEGLRILHREQIRDATPRPTMWSELADLIEAQAARISELERERDNAERIAVDAVRGVIAGHKAAAQEAEAALAEAIRDQQASAAMAEGANKLAVDMDREIARLREALAPFAKAGKRLEDWADVALQDDDDVFGIKLGDCRRARAALAEPSDG